MLTRLATLTRIRRLGWETYAWLVYSVPFLISAFNPVLSSRETAAMLASYPLFLALYLGGYFVRGWRILWIVAALDLLAAMFGARNPTASVFLIYGSAALGHALPVRRAIVALIAQIGVGVIPRRVQDSPR